MKDVVQKTKQTTSNEDEKYAGAIRTTVIYTVKNIWRKTNKGFRRNGNFLYTLVYFPLNAIKILSRNARIIFA
jgi:hypothetical protein